MHEYFGLSFVGRFVLNGIDIINGIERLWSRLE